MIERRVEKIFVDQLRVEVPDRDTDVIETGLVDSLTLVQLLSILEREFEVEMDLQELDLDDFRSIARIAGLLERKADPA